MGDQQARIVLENDGRDAAAANTSARKKRKTFQKERSILIERLSQMQQEIQNGSAMSDCRVQLEEMIQLTTKLDESIFEERK